MSVSPQDFGAHRGVGEDIPSFPGVLTSRRWFKITNTGVLIAPFRGTRYPSQDKPFVAQCKQGPFTPGTASAPWRYLNMFLATGDQAWLNNPKEMESRHKVGESACSCGFYSYYAEPDPQDVAGPVIGAIIENFGRITYGDRGLRSEKMRIKALVYQRTRKYGWKSYVHFWELKTNRMIALLLFLSAWLFLTAVTWGVGGGTHWLSLTSVNLTLTALGNACFTALASYVVVVLERRGEAGPFQRQLESWRIEALRENYPDLPFYTSWKEADKDFPHTKRKDLP